MRLAVTVLLFSCMAAAAAAQAIQPSPYDTTYAVAVPDNQGVPLRADMALGASVIATLPSDATGIVLRWCRPEIPFGQWQLGTDADRRAILDADRWCEVSWRGTVGALLSAALRPE